MKNRLLIAFVSFSVWKVVVFFGAFCLDFVLPELSRLWRMAIADVIVIGILAFVIHRYWHDEVMYALPTHPKRWFLLWLPALYIIGFTIIATKSGGYSVSFPHLMANAVFTLLIAISEELMFRGILFRALHGYMNNIWRATIVSALIFGLNHLTNVVNSENWSAGLAQIVTTFSPSLVQVVTTFSGGILLTAIMLRTGSIIPAIIEHWLWDFALMSIPSDQTGNFSAPAIPMLHQIGIAAIGIGIGFVTMLPILLYSIYLMRKTAKKEGALAVVAGRHRQREV